MWEVREFVIIMSYTCSTSYSISVEFIKEMYGPYLNVHCINSIYKIKL